MENKNIIRLKFTKKGGLKYISHLDLQRALARIIKRSHIPIRYTQGFNPHPKMVFGLPLSVGCESECELLDVYMIMDESKPNVPLYTPEEFKATLIPNLPIGLDYIDAYYPSKPFTSIQSAVYKVTVDLNTDESIIDVLKEAFSQPLIVLKKSKSGDRDVDISELIHNVEFFQNNKTVILNLTLSAQQNNYLNPELVMNALKKNSVINSAIDYYTVLRTEIIFSEQ